MLRFTRHARNNVRLYRISPSHIESAIREPEHAELQDRRTVVYKRFPEHYNNLPLKVVFETTGDDNVIVPAYPHKGSKTRTGL